MTTILEVVTSAALLVAGFYWLYDGSQNKTASGPMAVIAGAFCLAVSIVMLVSAVKSILWHRQALKHAMRGQHARH
ncbi:MAG TPA: hypothetical protein VK525_22475 [Candidatus Saccharimonadales bacterium]|nr:hypothetical protein [Candidatus Saccharimonadales bacterium]